MHLNNAVRKHDSEVWRVSAAVGQLERDTLEGVPQDFTRPLVKLKLLCVGRLCLVHSAGLHAPECEYAFIHVRASRGLCAPSVGAWSRPDALRREEPA